ncbi:family 20 glycosylhydrolase [Spirosoma arboris]|nr:family 20 glycosylhydrolase [Spirosoma arboris]
MLLKIKWELVQNQYQAKPQFLAALVVTNGSQEIMPVSGWKLYFNLRYHSPNLTALSKELTIKNVNGELFYLQPTLDFTPLKSGESVRLEFTGARRVANYQDAPSGFFWVNDATPQTAISANQVVVQPFIQSAQSTAEQARALFNENQVVQDIPIARLPKILPTPVSYRETNGIFTLDSRTTLVADESFQAEANYLSEEIKKLLGKPLPRAKTEPADKVIVLKKINLPKEAYELQVTPKRITISATDGTGIFYGIQSLKAILPTSVWANKQVALSVPTVSVSDAPRFAVRAFMLDVGRNFQPKQAILKLLEVMALYKLNVFHFHLTDDEGWRLAIPDLPELTQVGSQRGYPFSNNERLQPSYGSGAVAGRLMGSGFYSRADFIEILRYATQRHIRVVPEIESPGHARAAIKAMEARYTAYMGKNQPEEAERYRLTESNDQSQYRSAQYFTDNVMNAALPSTYRFIEKVIDEVQRMYTEAGAPLSMMHMGGDEVPHGAWEKSPAVIAQLQQDTSVKTAKGLSQFFFSRVKTMLKARGLMLTGWEELVVHEPAPDSARRVDVISDFIKDQVQLDAWWNMYGNEDIPYRMANAGYPTVLACFDHFYFDLAHKPGFAEPGDAWIGYLDIDKLFQFIPYDYYRNNRTDVVGNAWPSGHFDRKEHLTQVGKQHIAGLKGALWSENITADSLLNYMLLPRLLALAERAWAADPDWAKEPDSTRAKKVYDQAWSVFVNTLGKRELPKLDFYNGGYSYRIPAAGAMLIDGKIELNSQLPGLPIHYTTDGSEPSLKSPVYQSPISAKGRIRWRVLNQKGRGGQVMQLN